MPSSVCAIVVLAVVALLGVAVEVLPRAASAARAPTRAYVETRKAPTVITPSGPRGWLVDCITDAGGYVDESRRHRVIHVHYSDEQIGGLARIQPDGRWAIYHRNGGPGKLVGFVVRRTSARRKVGYAVGPDGPEAATPLLTLCRG